MLAVTKLRRVSMCLDLCGGANPMMLVIPILCYGLDGECACKECIQEQMFEVGHFSPSHTYAVGDTNSILALG